jgi:hypothetical protein
VTTAIDAKIHFAFSFKIDWQFPGSIGAQSCSKQVRDGEKWSASSVITNGFNFLAV